MRPDTKTILLERRVELSADMDNSNVLEVQVKALNEIIEIDKFLDKDNAKSPRFTVITRISR